MHDLLYENQQNLTDDFLVEYADKINLDVEQFKSDFKAPQYVEKVESDFESGLEVA